MENKDREERLSIEKKQEDRFRKDKMMKLQIKHQESLLENLMLKNKSILVSNMWQFNDTKTRLYQMDGDPNRRQFLDAYFAFIEYHGKPLRKLPVIARYPLDIFTLYSLVETRGGFDECTRTRQWSYVANDLQLPTSTTSAAYSLRTQYKKILYGFEHYQREKRERFENMNGIKKEQEISECDSLIPSMVVTTAVSQSQNKSNIIKSNTINSPCSTSSSPRNLIQQQIIHPLSLSIIEIIEQAMVVEMTIEGVTYKGTLLELS